MVSLPAAFLSVITSLPPLIATLLALPPTMPRPVIRVLVEHFCFLFLRVVHVLCLTNAAFENFRPPGRPSVTVATLGAPLPWVTLNFSFGCPLARPAVDPLTVGLNAQLVNLIAAETVLAAVPLCGVNVPPMLAGAQSVENALPPLGPVTFNVRAVSGTSGTLANVTELLLRFTAPVSEIANGAGNETVIEGTVPWAVSFTDPLESATLGTMGEVAVAVPIVQPVAFRHGASTPTFGVSPLGSWSTIVLLADSFAAWVIPRVSAPPLSFLSRVIAAVSTGA